VRAGTRLAVDVGSTRIGVARCDPDGLLASPLATIRRGHGDLDSLASLAADEGAIEVVVGLPTGLSGREGAAAAQARAFAGALAARLAPLPSSPTTPCARAGAGRARGAPWWTRPRPR